MRAANRIERDHDLHVGLGSRRVKCIAMGTGVDPLAATRIGADAPTTSFVAMAVLSLRRLIVSTR